MYFQPPPQLVLKLKTEIAITEKKKNEFYTEENLLSNLGISGGIIAHVCCRGYG